MPLQPLPPGYEIALEATPGGFGTPEFAWDGSRRQVRVDGAELVHSAGGESAVQPLAYSSAARCSNSNPTKRSSPTTHASWPGSIT